MSIETAEVTGLVPVALGSFMTTDITDSLDPDPRVKGGIKDVGQPPGDQHADGDEQCHGGHNIGVLLSNAERGYLRRTRLPHLTGLVRGGQAPAVESGDHHRDIVGAAKLARQSDQLAALGLQRIVPAKYPSDMLVGSNAVKAIAAKQHLGAGRRVDVVSDGGYPDAILYNAPDRIGNFFAVPKVVE